MFDYFIIDCSNINDTIICDSIVKSDHFATLSLLGLHVETKKVPVQQNFSIKRTIMHLILNTALNNKTGKNVC